MLWELILKGWSHKILYSKTVGMKIKQLNKYLFLIIMALVPMGVLAGNYIQKLSFFRKIPEYSNYLFEPAFIPWLLLIILFLFLALIVGKLDLSSFLITKKNALFGLKITIIPFLISIFVFSLHDLLATGSLDYIRVLLHIWFIITKSLSISIFSSLIFQGIFLLQFYLLLKKNMSNKLAISASYIATIFITLLYFLLVSKVSLTNWPILLSLLIVIATTNFVFLKTVNLIFSIGIQALFSYRIDSLIIIVTAIIIALLWNKIYPYNDNNYSIWKDGLQIDS